jgi:predicted phosphodiesterase|tara:strand:- start:1582 stop:2463 length:882 start_codon:yes stop_codon:yes gene_type:complete
MICPRCSSIQVKKDGKKTNSKGTRQEFKCNSCTRYFSIPIDTELKDGLKMVKPGEVFEYKSDEVVRVHGLTDVHVGANEFDLRKFNKAIKAIYEDDNAVWFGNGDLLELIPPNYKISQRGQEIPPDEQYLTFLDLIRPIKDKCLFIRGGNHDYLRSFNILDLDICKLMANEMNVPYFIMPGYAKITVKGQQWNLVSGHGRGGGKNGDLELDKMSEVYSQGDVFFLGHNHQLYAKPMDSLRIDGNKERLYRRWYVRGGSFLRYAEYARYSFYPIVRTGWTTMEFTKDNINCWTN